MSRFAITLYALVTLPLVTLPTGCRLTDRSCAVDTAADRESTLETGDYSVTLLEADCLGRNWRSHRRSLLGSTRSEAAGDRSKIPVVLVH